MGHDKFAIPLKHQVVMSSRQFSQILEFKNEFWVRDIQFRMIKIEMLLKIGK